MKNLISQPRKLSWSKFVPFIGVAVAVGVFVIVVASAAGPSAAFEVESGTLSGAAVVTSLTGQSGAGVVKFSSPSTPSPSPSATPMPTSTPTGSRSCPAYPAFPDGLCTGVPAGISLTASGSITAITPNQVIQNLDITGQIIVKATNVTIKNCKIHGGSGPGISIQSGNAIIIDSELYGMADEAIGFDNWAAYRVNIHDVVDDGVKFGDNVTLEDSYLHDFTPSAGAHADGGQLQSGLSNLIIRHNNINITSGNAALMMAPDLGPNGAGPVIIDRNLLGGGGYTLYIVDGNNGQYHQKGYAVTNNHFLRNFGYGPINVNEPASSFSVWSGNVYHDNGAVIGI